MCLLPALPFAWQEHVRFLSFVFACLVPVVLQFLQCPIGIRNLAYMSLWTMSCLSFCLQLICSSCRVAAADPNLQNVVIVAVCSFWLGFQCFSRFGSRGCSQCGMHQTGELSHSVQWHIVCNGALFLLFITSLAQTCPPVLS